MDTDIAIHIYVLRRRARAAGGAASPHLFRFYVLAKHELFLVDFDVYLNLCCLFRCYLCLYVSFLALSLRTSGRGEGRIQKGKSHRAALGVPPGDERDTCTAGFLMFHIVIPPYAISDHHFI